MAQTFKEECGDDVHWCVRNALLEGGGGGAGGAGQRGGRGLSWQRGAPPVGPTEPPATRWVLKMTGIGGDRTASAKGPPLQPPHARWFGAAAVGRRSWGPSLWSSASAPAPGRRGRGGGGTSPIPESPDVAWPPQFRCASLTWGCTSLIRPPPNTQHHQACTEKSNTDFMACRINSHRVAIGVTRKNLEDPLCATLHASCLFFPVHLSWKRR